MLRLACLAILCLAPAVQGQEFVLPPLWTAGGTGSGIGEYGVPESVAIDSLGRVAVTDKGRMRLHVYDHADGRPLFDVGAFGTALGQFNRPNGITVTGDGRILVVEQINQRVQILDRDYRPLGSFGGSGPDAGHFAKPMGIALDPDGRIYVTDEARADVQVFDPAGTFLFAFASRPPLQKVESIEVDAARGRVYVCDEGRSCVNVYDMQGRYLQSFGEQGTGPGQFGNDTNAVRIDGKGRIYVNDQGNARLNVYAPDYRFLASFRCAGRDMQSADGVTLSEGLDLILVADQGNDRILAFDLGELQCRLAQIELDSPAAAVGPLRVRQAGRDVPAPDVTLWADAKLDLEAPITAGDPTRIESAVAHLRSGRDRRGICVPLVETGPATNVLAAQVQLAMTSDEAAAQLGCADTDRLDIHWAGQSDELQLDIVPVPPLQIEHLQFDGRDPDARVFSAEPYATWRCIDPIGPRQQTAFEIRILSPELGVIGAGGPIPSARGAWAWNAPALEPGGRYEFQLRVASGRVWSDWLHAPVQHNAPPAAIVSYAPATGTVLRDWPVRLEARLGPEPDGDALRAAFELWLPDGSRRRSPALAVVDASLAWLPTFELPENGLLHWRIVALDGREKQLGEWWSVARNRIEEPPSPPILEDPADGAIVHAASVTLRWAAAIDPDPGSSLQYDVEWSADPSFATSRTLPAGAALAVQWADPTPDGRFYWRVRVRDATGNWSRSPARQLQLARDLALDLQVTDSHQLRSAVLLGARSGATDGYTPGEDRLATVTLHGPRMTSRLESPRLELATDWRAPRDPATGSWSWRLRLQGQASETLLLEARSLKLPGAWRVRIEVEGGALQGTLARRGDRLPIPLDALGEAQVLVTLTASPGASGPDLGFGAAPASETDTSAGAVAPFPGVVDLGLRLQLAPASAAGVPFEIYDVRGRRVRRERTSPDGAWAWDGRDGRGARLATGVYWLRLLQPAASTHKIVWRAR